MKLSYENQKDSRYMPIEPDYTKSPDAVLGPWTAPLASTVCLYICIGAKSARVYSSADGVTPETLLMLAFNIGRISLASIFANSDKDLVFPMSLASKYPR